MYYYLLCKGPSQGYRIIKKDTGEIIYQAEACYVQDGCPAFTESRLGPILWHLWWIDRHARGTYSFPKRSRFGQSWHPLYASESG